MNLIHSFKVGSTLTAQRVVSAVAGTANTCQYPATVTSFPLGITVDDVKNTGEAIPVQMNGIARLYFNDTCAAGALVGFDTSGRGVAAATTTMAAIGVLVGATVALTGTIAEVAIFPQRP